MKTTFLLITFIYSGIFCSAGHRHQDSFGINDSLVSAIGITDKHIWVGTSEGLFKINKRNNSAVHYSTANSLLPSNRVTDIAVLSDNSVWVGTDKGILRHDGFTFIEINKENSNLPEGKIRSLKVDSKDILWLMMSNGEVWYYQDRNFAKLELGNSKVIPDSNSQLIPLSNGNIMLKSKLANRNILIRNKEEIQICGSKCGVLSEYHSDQIISSSGGNIYLYFEDTAEHSAMRCNGTPKIYFKKNCTGFTTSSAVNEKCNTPNSENTCALLNRFFLASENKIYHRGLF